MAGTGTVSGMSSWPESRPLEAADMICHALDVADSKDFGNLVCGERDLKRQALSTPRKLMGAQPYMDIVINPPDQRERNTMFGVSGDDRAGSDGNHITSAFAICGYDFHSGSYPAGLVERGGVEHESLMLKQTTETGGLFLIVWNPRDAA